MRNARKRRAKRFARKVADGRRRIVERRNRAKADVAAALRSMART